MLGLTVMEKLKNIKKRFKKNLNKINKLITKKKKVTDRGLEVTVIK